MADSHLDDARRSQLKMAHSVNASEDAAAATATVADAGGGHAIGSTEPAALVPALRAAVDNDAAHAHALFGELEAAGDFLPPESLRLIQSAVELHDLDPIAKSSISTYAAQTKLFEEFCAKFNFKPYSPSSVAAYIGFRVSPPKDPDAPDDAPAPKPDTPSTLKVRLAAIRREAAERGLPDPTAGPAMRATIGKISKKLRHDPRRVDAAKFADLQRIVDAASGPSRLRDRALLLLGFATGKRGAELAALQYDDVRPTRDGIIVRIVKTKVNQHGESEFIGVPAFPGDPYCPVAALNAWLANGLDGTPISTGPLFRSMSSKSGPAGAQMHRIDIARILKSLAQKANLPGVWRSHSLRRGVVTSAEQSGVARSRTRLLTAWTSDAMFSTYAAHDDLVGQSPLHEIYGKRLAPANPSLFPEEP